MKHRYYVRIFFNPQLLYRTKPNKNGKRKPTSTLYSNTFGSTAKNYLGFVCLEFFSTKKEKRKILKNLNNQKPGGEEGHPICVKPISEFQLQRKFNNSVFVMLNWVPSPYISLIWLKLLFWIVENLLEKIFEKAIKLKFQLKK